MPPPSHYYSQPPTQAPPKKKVRVGRNDKPSSAEELDFFDKCKRVIGNKTTYNEFLKILNLFTQETIEAKVLIERVEPFFNGGLLLEIKGGEKIEVSRRQAVRFKEMMSL